MDSYIKKQLQAVKNVKLEFDDDTTRIFIPKIKIPILIEGNTYRVKLKDSILHPDEMNTLAANWNQGRIPEAYESYWLEVLNVMNHQMAKVIAVAETNPAYQFEGWLPVAEIEVLEKC